jgi:hypothetical protein
VSNTCGRFLDDCRCHPGHQPTRTLTEIRAAHRASVARAKRSGFAAEPPPGWLFTLLDPAGINLPDPTGRNWAA